jgi:hypothetical protein
VSDPYPILITTNKGQKMEFIAWGYSEIIDTDGDEARDYSDEYYFTSEEKAKAFMATLSLDYSEVSPVSGQCGCLEQGDICHGFGGDAWCSDCI